MKNNIILIFCKLKGRGHWLDWTIMFLLILGLPRFREFTPYRALATTNCLGFPLLLLAALGERADIRPALGLATNSFVDVSLFYLKR